MLHPPKHAEKKNKNETSISNDFYEGWGKKTCLNDKSLDVPLLLPYSLTLWVTVPKMVPSIYLTHGTDDLRHMYISSTTSLLSYDHLKRPLMV